MKYAYIETKYQGKVVLPKKFLKTLPKHVALFTTIQFVYQIESIKKQLEKEGVKVDLIKTKHTKKLGQMYGCNIEKFEGNFEAFVYIGDGLFHPKAIMLYNEKNVYAFDPFDGSSAVLDKKDAKSLEKKQRAALAGFLSSKVIGVLITTKPGQQFLKKALALKKKFPKKQFYFILFNIIDFQSLEDFSFVECFVNTACPRIAYDDTNKFRKPVVDVWELDKLEV